MTEIEIEAEAPNYGFWNRLTAAVVAASAVFFAEMAIFTIPQLLSEHASFPNPELFVSVAGGYIGIIVLAVFVVGYPIERFWVKASDSLRKAATKQAVVIPAVVLLWTIAQVLVALVGSNKNSVYLSQFYIYLVVAVAAFVCALTAYVARLLYSVFVKRKLAMYIIGALLGAIALYPYVRMLILLIGAPQ